MNALSGLPLNQHTAANIHPVIKKTYTFQFWSHSVA